MSAAVVTGAGRGIGRAIAFELARRGAHVVLTDVDEDAAAEAAAEVGHAGGRADAMRCDVTREDDVREVAAAYPHADTVVANAGVLVIAEAVSTDMASFRRAIDVNLFGVAHTCRAFAPAMASRGRGGILIVASAAGMVPLPLMGAYAASKAAVLAYGDALRAELGPDGVAVTALCPSFTKTHLVERADGRDAGGRALGQRLIDLLGEDADDIARLGLDALAHGAPYAIPRGHASVVRRLRAVFPDASCVLSQHAYRLYRRFASSSPEAEERTRTGPSSPLHAPAV